MDAMLRLLNKAWFRWTAAGLAAAVLLAGMAMPVPGQIRRVVTGRDKMAHALAFGVLSLVMAWAIASWPRFRLALCALAAVLLSSLYGALTELVQYFVPGRWADVADFRSDVLGALVGSALFVGLALPFSRKKELPAPPLPARGHIGVPALLVCVVITVFWATMMGLLVQRHVRQYQKTGLTLDYDRLLPPNVNRIERRMGIYFHKKRFGFARTLIEKTPDEVELKNILSINFGQIPRPFRFFPRNVVVHFDATFSPLTGLRSIAVRSKETGVNLFGQVVGDTLMLSGQIGTQRVNEKLPFAQQSVMSDMLSPLQGLPELRRSDVGREWVVTLINPITGQPQPVKIRVDQMTRQRVRVSKPDRCVIEFTSDEGSCTVPTSDYGRLLALSNVPNFTQREIGEQWRLDEEDPRTGQVRRRKVEVIRLVRYSDGPTMRNAFILEFQDTNPPHRIWLTDDGRPLPLHNVFEINRDEKGRVWSMVVDDPQAQKKVAMKVRIKDVIAQPSHVEELNVFVLQFTASNSIWNTWVSKDGEVLQQGTPFGVVLKREDIIFLDTVAVIRRLKQ